MCIPTPWLLDRPTALRRSHYNQVRTWWHEIHVELLQHSRGANVPRRYNSNNVKLIIKFFHFMYTHIVLNIYKWNGAIFFTCVGIVFRINEKKMAFYPTLPSKLPKTTKFEINGRSTYSPRKLCVYMALFLPSNTYASIMWGTMHGKWKMAYGKWFIYRLLNINLSGKSQIHVELLQHSRGAVPRVTRRESHVMSELDYNAIGEGLIDKPWFNRLSK